MIKMHVQGHLSMAMQVLEAEGLSWLPGAANIVTITCFTMSLILSRALEQASFLPSFQMPRSSCDKQYNLFSLNIDHTLWVFSGVH